MWTDCDEAGDYVVPNVLRPRDLDNMDETILHTCSGRAKTNRSIFPMRRELTRSLPSHYVNTSVSMIPL